VGIRAGVDLMENLKLLSLCNSSLLFRALIPTLGAKCNHSCGPTVSYSPRFGEPNVTDLLALRVLLHAFITALSPTKIRTLTSRTKHIPLH
jgi:hypothetical protein